jgi:GR25 family glycosyltransferase involved in LPS biosynthesis
MTKYIIILIILFLIICNSQIREDFTNINIQDKLIYPIYWINLDKSHERRNSMLGQLNRLNITKHKRISGIDGGKLYTYNCKIPPNNQSNSELGCLISHITAILTARQDKLNRVLIVEDDICLEIVNKWEHTIDNIIKKAPVDWEILQLFVSDTNVMIELLPVTVPYVQWEKYKYYGAVCYLINRSGMNKIHDTLVINNKIQLPTNHILTSDEFIYKICKTYVYTKPLFIHKAPVSTIHNSHRSRHIRAKNFLLKYYNIKSINCD